MKYSEQASYRGTFPAGFRSLVERLVLRDFGTQNLDGDESSILFSGPWPLRRPAYLQSLALVIARCKSASIDDAYKLFARQLSAGEAQQALQRCLSSPLFLKKMRPSRFVLRSIERGQPCAVSPSTRSSLEKVISAATLLGADSEHPDLELQVSLREDGQAYIQVLAKKERFDEKGALPPWTCRLLIELSTYSKDDTFLDPFMGSGAIALERARTAPYKLIFAGDLDESLVQEFKAQLKEKEWEKRRKTIFPKILDARDLTRFDAAFFSAIVSDPPWGQFENLGPDEILDLYSRFLKEARRILKRAGKLVLLLARDAPLEAALTSEWQLEEDYAVLISGRKARVVVLS
ncbi:hypothetical protein MASR2M78_25700 [Treponema sp.]